MQCRHWRQAHLCSHPKSATYDCSTSGKWLLSLSFPIYNTEIIILASEWCYLTQSMENKTFSKRDIGVIIAGGHVLFSAQILKGVESEALRTSVSQAFSQPRGYTSFQGTQWLSQRGAGKWLVFLASASASLFPFGSPFSYEDDCPSPGWQFYHCQGACQGIWGWRIGGQSWEGTICTNPFRSLRLQSYHFNEGQKQLSPKSMANGLKPARKSRQWKLIDINVIVAHVILGRDGLIKQH